MDTLLDNLQAGMTQPRRLLNKTMTKLALLVLLSFCSYLFFSRVVVMAVQVQGASMAPTLIPGNLVLLNRFTYLHRSPERGDLVVLKDPETGDLVVKRIVALPEEFVHAGPDQTYVNGRLLAEPYLDQPGKKHIVERQIRHVAVPKDHFYVLGDNRHVSIDSRYFGPVPRSSILGTIKL